MDLGKVFRGRTRVQLISKPKEISVAKSIRSGSGPRGHAASGIPGAGDDSDAGTIGEAGRTPPAGLRPQERLLRVERDLLRGMARREEPAVLLERAIGWIREAGGYRSVRYHTGDGLRLDGTFGSSTGLILPGEVNGRRHGLLVIEIDPARPPDEAERRLLEECADDLALAFHLEYLEHARQETVVRILESEERFRQVFHQTSDAILLYEVDPAGGAHRCLEANEQACRWLGYSLDELRQFVPADLIDPPCRTGAPPWDRTEPGPYRFDAPVRRRDGVTSAVISLHRFNLLGRPVMLIVARDVAEERRREREQADSLRQIQQNMEQFQILNDQIRNPVQVIIGLADMEGGDVGSLIIRQAYEIDEIVRQLDVGWLESAKVSAYLRRYGS
jgi:PAS domain S-box-containing protein